MGSASRKTFLPLDPMTFSNESKAMSDFIFNERLSPVICRPSCLTLPLIALNHSKTYSKMSAIASSQA
ncbi:tyrosine decarboxylase 1-like [Gossypium australe]|uniref:Tyrosine decarboxylase 1-like n=1 Tax=Gossypium australe TaxID=47621 RepID=A0A5B6WWZ2_9ROSI|nr:tyrosine decarboxylase 1-like [Gossypium australe]